MTMQEKEHTRKEKPSLIEPFLKGVLRKTFIPFSSARLKEEKMDLVGLRQPGARQDFEYLANNPRMGEPTMRGARVILEDFDGFIEREEERYGKMVEKYRRGTKEFRDFIGSHSDAINYIASLVEGDGSKPEIPSEETVFNIFTRLSKSFIIDFSNPENSLGQTLNLDRVVRTAATEHARRTGQNPNEYLEKVYLHEEKSIVL